MSFNFLNRKWGEDDLGTPGGELTWTMSMAGLSFNSVRFPELSVADFEDALRAAFDAWEAVADIEFTEVPNPDGTLGDADVDFDLDFSPLAGSTVGIAATSFRGGSNDGDGISVITDVSIDFDTDVTWLPNAGSGGVSLFAVAVHEIGHGLGLGHVDDTSEILNPFISTDVLGDGDIEGIQEIYGPPPVEMQTGGANNDVLTGTSAADYLTGEAGSDRLFGGAGSDTLTGGEGRDLLDGGDGADVLDGGLDNDVYVIDAAGDRILGEIAYSAGGGVDTVRAFIDFTQPTNIEIVRLGTGTDTAPLRATGNDAPGTLVGNAGSNVLVGRGGNDQINGNDGDDLMTGNTGRDTLVGGAGADTFIYTSVSESRAGTEARDVINGFDRGADQIDLSALDANLWFAGDAAFEFIGTDRFDGAGAASAGQVRLQGVGGPNAVLVEADLRGDGVADMQIFVNLTTVLLESDFIL